MVKLRNEISINQHLWTHEPTRPLEEIGWGVPAWKVRLLTG